MPKVCFQLDKFLLNCFKCQHNAKSVSVFSALRTKMVQNTWQAMGAYIESDNRVFDFELP